MRGVIGSLVFIGLIDTADGHAPPAHNAKPAARRPIRHRNPQFVTQSNKLSAILSERGDIDGREDRTADATVATTH
jgi:hypothetical protein